MLHHPAVVDVLKHYGTVSGRHLPRSLPANSIYQLGERERERDEEEEEEDSGNRGAIEARE